jgi:hypothetical protein
MAALIDVGVVPVTVAAETVVVPEERLETVEYVKDVVVLAPFAVTDPLSVALVEATEEAAEVVTDGAVDALKFKMEPSTNEEQVQARILK